MVSLFCFFFFSRHLCIPMVSISDFSQISWALKPFTLGALLRYNQDMESLTVWDPSSLGKAVVCSVITRTNCVIRRLFKGY